MQSTPKPRRTQSRLDPTQGNRPPEVIELVDPTWILKALGLMLGIGAICGYITLCFVFAHSQWQLVLHPAHNLSATPAAVGLSFEEVHFGYRPGASGDLPAIPQLNGWWMPTVPTDPTALILHSGDGSMADALTTAHTLHDAGLNILLFDYRGFGPAPPDQPAQHPTQQLMQQDALAALNYLTTTRHIPTHNIILYGTGVGASIALQLAADVQAADPLPALILDNPTGDLAASARADIRSRMVPFSLLFNQNFPLAAPLRTLPTPKLLLSHTNGPAPAIFQQAADPKMTVELPPHNTAAEIQSIRRFLATYTH